MKRDWPEYIALVGLTHPYVTYYMKKWMDSSYNHIGNAMTDGSWIDSGNPERNYNINHFHPSEYLITQITKEELEHIQFTHKL